jgi:hypothetical protein
MKSEILELELILIKTGNLVLLLNFLLFIYGKFQQNGFSKPIYSIHQLTKYLFFLSMIELILIKFILVREFRYFEQVNDFLTSFGIKTYDFISPPSYLIKFIFLGLFFRTIFKNNHLSNFYKFLIPSLVFFELIMIFYFKSYQSYDSISSTVKNIFIISSSGFLLYNIYKSDISNISLYKNTYFWIGFALFITALSELFLEFIFTQLHKTDAISFLNLYLVRNAFQMAFFIMMIVAFLNTKYLRFLPEKY